MNNIKSLQFELLDSSFSCEKSGTGMSQFIRNKKRFLEKISSRTELACVHLNMLICF